MTSVAVLGPLQVLSSDGEDITPAGERERVAFLLLAVASPQVVSTERLSEELYGADGVTDPRNAVHALISRLRKALGRSAGMIETHGRGYRIVDVALDIDEAARRFRQAADAEGADAKEAIDACLELWRGPSLADVALPQSLAAEQHRLDELRRSAEDRRFELRLHDVSDHSLIADLESATRSEPTRERRWALLMEAQYRQGRQADALATYQRARLLLAESLGLAPGPQLTDLEARILRHDPGLLAPSRSDATDETSEASVLPEGAVSLPSGTLTVLLCEVAGSVAAWEARPDTTAGEVADLHAIWARHTSAAGGLVVRSTGDGVMAVFVTASDAIRAAVGAQTDSHGLALDVSVAIHAGPLQPTGHDYRGPVINRCARLLELCTGGQILVTQTVAGLARDDLTDVTIRSLGVHHVRDIIEPFEVFQVEATGLPSAFADLRSGGPPNLPRLSVEVIGRAALLDELAGAVVDHTLVTLLGPGGIGKTTLALASAWSVVDQRRVVFVDLAAVADPRSVPPRIADAVAPGETHRLPEQRVADRLRLADDLIVLDNAEHVNDAVAEFVDSLMANDLIGTILTTSRSPLAVPGEHLIAVPPLDVPDGDDLVATSQTPAVALFLARLRHVRSDAVVGNGMLPVVAHVCRRLDGIPLAIELAASRGALLAIDDIAARLDDQLRLLRQVPAVGDRRHRSLEAVVNWSLDLLGGESRRLFGLLSVFAGSFTVEAVEAVVENAGLDPEPVLDSLMELRAASLLAIDGGSGVRMLEPIRQVAAAELEAGGRARHVRHAHAEWATGLLRAAFAHLGPERMTAVEAADVHSAEIRVAAQRIGQDGFADLVPGFAVPGGYWFLTRDPQHGDVWRSIAERFADDELVGALASLGWNIAVADLPSDTRLGRTVEVLDRHRHPDRVMARVIQALQLVQDGMVEEAGTALDEAEDLNGRSDPWVAGYVNLARAMVGSLPLPADDDAVTALTAPIESASRSAETFREVGDRWSLGVALSELGRLRQQAGDLVGAEVALLESLELVGEAEYHGAHTILSELGVLAGLQGRWDAAADYHHRAIEVAGDLGGRHCVAVAHVHLSRSAHEQGDHAAQVAALEAAVDLVGGDEAQRLGWVGRLDEARERLGRAG